jgi:hypothetical protein
VRVLQRSTNPDQGVNCDVIFSWCGDLLVTKWFALLKGVITEDVQLEFDPEKGIIVKTFDQFFHIGFVSSVLNPSFFSEYRVTRLPPSPDHPDGENRKIVVDLELFSVVLSKVKLQDEVHVYYVHNDCKFYIDIRAAATKTSFETETRWEIPTVDKQYDIVEEPVDFIWDATVTLPSQELFNMIRDLSAVSDIAVLTIDSDGFEMKAQTDVGSAKRRINEFSKNNTVQLLGLTAPTSPANLPVTLKILMKAVPLCALAKIVTVKLYCETKDSALCLEALFDNEKGSLSYWQAGRIKEDDIF